MVALEVVQHGENTEISQEVEELREENKIEVKFKPAEITSVTPKSQIEALFGKLKNLADNQEQQSHQLNLSTVGGDDCIGMCERDSAVTTIKSMQRFYNYKCDTLADAVNFLDRFISKVKIKSRYLSCVAAAAFFLSTKMNEESEYHPSASDLSSLHRHTWKPSDLKRMEKILLEKLDWNLYPSMTSLSYIHLIYRILVLVSADIDRQFLELLIERLELYMNYARCARYSASALAVSTVHQCLKETDLSNMVTKCIILHVQAVCRISDSELLDCQCAISQQLEIYTSHPSTHPRCLPLPKIVPRPNLIRRPSFYGNTDLPTIEEVPWSCESREEDSPGTELCLYGDVVVSYYPTQSVNMNQRYCRLLDQCYPRDHSALIYYKKCNMSMF